MSIAAVAVIDEIIAPLVEAVLRILGLSVLAAVTTGVVAFAFRARTGQPFPEGATLILGLGVVAIYLNTRLIFIQFVGEAGDPLTPTEAIGNITVFLAAGIASYLGRYGGTKAAVSDRFSVGKLHPDLSPIVRASGRTITVTVPEEIADIPGYDPVAEETKRALAGRSIDLPRGLTLAEVRRQVVDRLEEEHDIGHVDIDLTPEGTVEYLGVGQRPRGLGPTIPPNAAVVAVRADPPFSAAPGDTVQVWQTDETGETYIGAGEFRASVGRVATIVLDESAAELIDPTATYRLMTLPATAYPDREFAGLLRRANETMDSITVGANSPLVGQPIGDIKATVIAIRSPTDTVETIPSRDRKVAAAETLFAIGSPETLRRLTELNDTTRASNNPQISDEAITFDTEDPRQP